MITAKLTGTNTWRPSQSAPIARSEAMTMMDASAARSRRSGSRAESVSVMGEFPTHGSFRVARRAGLTLSGRHDRARLPNARHAANITRMPELPDVTLYVEALAQRV